MAKKTNATVGTGEKKYEYYRIQYKVPGEFRTDKHGFHRPVIKNFYGESKKAAEAMRDEWIRAHEHDSGVYFGPEMDYFLTVVLFNDSKLSIATRELYLRAWRGNFGSQSFLSQDVSDVDAKQLQAEIDHLTCAPTTKRHIVTLLKRFYGYLAVEYGTKDVTSHLHAPKTNAARQSTEQIEVWPEDELRQFIDSLVGHRLRLLFVLAAATGGRLGELLGLRYDDIRDDQVYFSRQIIGVPTLDEAGNIESRQLDVGDTKSMNSVRSIPLSENTLQEIERHKAWHDQEATDRGYDHHGFVFTSNSGRLLNKANVSRSLARACRRAGVTERHFHTLRATFITRLARAGVPIQIVSALAGHSDISVTARYYIGVSETEKKDAISKLDGGMVAKDVETDKTKGE